MSPLTPSTDATPAKLPLSVETARSDPTHEQHPQPKSPLARAFSPTRGLFVRRKKTAPPTAEEEVYQQSLAFPLEEASATMAVKEPAVAAAAPDSGVVAVADAAAPAPSPSPVASAAAPEVAVFETDKTEEPKSQPQEQEEVVPTPLATSSTLTSPARGPSVMAAGLSRFREGSAADGLSEAAVWAELLETPLATVPQVTESPSSLADRIQAMLLAPFLGIESPEPQAEIEKEHQNLLSILSQSTIMNGNPLLKEGMAAPDEVDIQPSVWSTLEERGAKHHCSSVMISFSLKPNSDVKLADCADFDSEGHCISHDTHLATAKKSGWSWWPFGQSAPDPAPAPPQRVWYPSTENISLHGMWWGYSIYLPPPVMKELSENEVTTVRKISTLTTALSWALKALPGMVELGPAALVAVTALSALVPILGYISSFIGWSWGNIKANDKGQGVILSATWLVPVALITRSWDAPNPPAALQVVAPAALDEPALAIPTPTIPARQPTSATPATLPSPNKPVDDAEHKHDESAADKRCLCKCEETSRAA